MRKRHQLVHAVVAHLLRTSGEDQQLLDDLGLALEEAPGVVQTAEAVAPEVGALAENCGPALEEGGEALAEAPEIVMEALEADPQEAEQLEERFKELQLDISVN